MSGKKEYTPFQLKIISLFEDEILTRLEKTGSKIYSEDDVMTVVDACYEELFDAQTDIETGAVDVCKKPHGVTTH